MSVLATDSFAGGNASPPNANWTNGSGVNGLRTISNALANVTADSDSAAFYNAITTPDDQYVQLKVTTLGTGGTANDGGPAARMDSSGNCIFPTNYDGTTIYCFERVGGSFNQLATAAGSYAVNDVIRTEVEGTTVRIKQNGSTILTTSTSNLPTGDAGAFIYDGTIRFDDFEVGDFNTGATLSPTAVTTAVTFGSHTISTGAQTISPNGIASAVAFGSHTVVKDVTSSGIPSAAEYGSHTLTLDGQSIQVTAIGSAAVYGSHTLSQVGQSLLPTAVGTAAVYGSHTVADVNLQIEPGGIASAAVYGAHVVATAGTQVVSPTGIGSAVAYGSHAVANATPQAVSPVAVASAAVYGSNTVGLVLETIIVPGIGTAGQVGRPTLIGGISPTEFYIGSSNVTIDDRVEEDRPIGAGNVQQPLGDLE